MAIQFLFFTLTKRHFDVDLTSDVYRDTVINVITHEILTGVSGLHVRVCVCTMYISSRVHKMHQLQDFLNTSANSKDEHLQWMNGDMRRRHDRNLK